MARFSLITCLAVALQAASSFAADVAKRPNILFAISDDQSYPHCSAYGNTAVKTPAFDRIAEMGVLFHQAFSGSPGCSPSRACILTGRYPWQLEHAGTHASSFSAKYEVFPDLLETAGYAVGYTGKGWGPGNYQDGGRSRNPAGPEFSKLKLPETPPGIRSTDYAGNFEAFLETRKEGQPFCFWYGSSEPHRVFKKGIGREQGKRLEEAVVPPFLPDTPEIRSDILDYSVEIEWFDKHLARMLSRLRELGELENTLIIATSDNGMAFPRAKANVYEYGIHLPLAISWPERFSGGKDSHALVSFVDFAPTILEAAGVRLPQVYPMTGVSLLTHMSQEEPAATVDGTREAVFSGRERHSSSRYQNWTYPQRALRNQQYLYIRNFRPERWPAGAPQKYDQPGQLGVMHGAYHDIDACPSMTFLIDQRNNPKMAPYFHLAVDKRPAEELFRIDLDEGCLVNLAQDPRYQADLEELRQALEKALRQHGDSRLGNDPDIWERYRRYSRIRSFPKPD